MSEFTENHIFKVFQAYARKNSLVLNQLESYNDFVTMGLQEIVQKNGKIFLNGYQAEFGQITLSNPQVIEEDRSVHDLWPMDARLRSLSYDCAVFCDIAEKFEDGEVKHHNRVMIGRLPVMLRSCICNLSGLTPDQTIEKGECSSDPGGYFIIKGHERVLVSQMRAVYNNVFVLKQKSGEKYKWIAEVRSMSDETGHSVLIKAMIGNDDRSIDFSLPYIKEPIPVGVVFKALGYKEEDIVNLIALDNDKANMYIRYILRDSFFCATQEEALKHISQYAMHIITDDKKIDYARQVIETETLPHLGISGTVFEQACFLGRMVRRLLMTHLGLRSEDDRDNYANKRVECAGTLLYDIFRNLFKKYVQYIQLQLEKRKRPDIMSVITRVKSITKGIYTCMSTGNWGVQKNASYIRPGVSQILDRMTYCATLSHLRRVIIPTGKEGKNTAMRQIHGSSFGFVCPCECFHPDTKILTWSGETKLAKNIKVDDILIDEKGYPARVKSTCFGRKRMYKVVHDNPDYEDYVVTDNHILTLRAAYHNKIFYTEDGYVLKILDRENHCYKDVYPGDISPDDNIIDITIEDYLKLDKEFRDTLTMFKAENIEWEEKPVYNPYIYGVSVGQLNGPISRDYLINSRSVREKVLEGIREVPIRYEHVHPDIIFLARSLGLYCFPDEKGDVGFTKCQPSTFMLIEQHEQPFVGWQLEGNGRFLLSDFTVTHNTPEGQKIGVVLNFALLARVSKKIPKILVKNVLEKCSTIIPTENVSLSNMKDYTPVSLNGGIIGFSLDPNETVEEIKQKRSYGLLDREVSVSYDIVDNDIRIFCDEGRFTRPLFTLTDNELNIKGEEKYKWNSLVKKGVIQYLDSAEIENSVIAMTLKDLKIQKNDFCEIHPCVMLGIMAALIPFSDHSQSPRNCYQSSMGKQALGIPTLSYNLRTDTLLHVLHYPQRPLVCTKQAEIFGINDMPSGINAIVAIACYSGYNQEDSVMLNLSSIQRGLFCLTSYHTIETSEKKSTYSYEEICLPPLSSDPTVKSGEPGYFRRKVAVNYSLLDEHGVIKPRERFENGKWVGPATRVKKGDVLIGKVIVTTSKSSEDTKIDASVIVQPGEEGVIDRVHTVITPNGYKLVKIVIRVLREPTLGDKLASRAAQKGTIGMVYRQEDMPFTSQGITPDIIINPLCIPSRMTINQLIECALGKDCAINGTFADATPFTTQSVDIADKLVSRLGKDIQNYGFQPQGCERMYNGMTGEMIQSQIFIGPTYYQRLKHMVSDKMHARAQGHVTMLTRQPLEGRSKEGGLRFGEISQMPQWYLIVLLVYVQ